MKSRFSMVILFAVLCSFFLPTLLFGQIPTAISDPITHKQIIRFIEKWRQAWQNKQIEEYIDCYAENFKDGEKNLRAWRKHKENLNRRYKQIRVEVDEIKIDLHNNSSADVQFYQVYKSDKYVAEGNKLLVLTYTEKGWQILREIWLK